MALAVVTVRPDDTLSEGSGTLVGSAASMDAALADSSDTTYVELSGDCRLDDEVIRVGFPTPTIPDGAKVYSVTLRRRTQTVVVTDPINNPPPVCHHWFRCLLGLIEILGQAQRPERTYFNSTCPTSSTTSEWVEETIFTATTAPGGAAWDPDTNLTGFAYEIGRAANSTFTLRVSAVYLDVTYQQASTVSVTAPTGDSTDTRPTIEWTYASPDSQPQQAYRVAVYTAAQVAADGFAAFTTTPIQASAWTPGTSWSSTSGWLLGEDLQWTLTSDLTDGDYAAYVQATSRWSGPGDFETEVDSTTWTRAATPVDPPANAVLNSATYDADNYRVVLNFESGGDETDPATTAFTVEGSTDNGVTWVAIPRLTYIAADGSNDVTDYDYNFHALNVPVIYRVIAYSGSVLNAALAPSNTKTVTPAGDQNLLKDPSNPLLNTVLPIAAPRRGDGIKVTERQIEGIFQLIGSAGTKRLPIAVSGANSGLEYEIEALFILGEASEDYYEPVVQLQRSGKVLLWQRPDGNVWVMIGSGFGGQDTQETYNMVSGNPRKVSWRRRKLTLTEQDPPSFF